MASASAALRCASRALCTCLAEHLTRTLPPLTNDVGEDCKRDLLRRDGANVEPGGPPQAPDPVRRHAVLDQARLECRRLAPARDTGDIARPREKRGAERRPIAPALSGDDDEASGRRRLCAEIEAFDPPLHVHKALLVRGRRRHSDGKSDAASEIRQGAAPPASRP